MQYCCSCSHMSILRTFKDKDGINRTIILFLLANQNQLPVALAGNPCENILFLNFTFSQSSVIRILCTIPVLTSLTIKTALLAPCTRALVQLDRSRCISTRNTWASTPFRVPDLVPKVRISQEKGNVEGCLPE